MYIPPNHTESQVVATIQRVVNQLAPSFTFGTYDVDDIKQEGFTYAIELLDKRTYDPARPLEAYLRTHIRNRLINLRRNKLIRSDYPCRRCHEGDHCSDGQMCKKYADWRKRNYAKANLQQPLDIDFICDEKESRTHQDSEVEFEAEASEMLRKIDENLPVELRSAYLQMRSGVSLPKAKRRLVEDAIKEILNVEA